MQFNVKHVGDHYELYVDGKFQGSYDTFSEAVKSIEEIDWTAMSA